MVEKIAHMIDHTVLKPEATMEDIVHLCKEAVQYGFASVCIQPCYVAKAAELVKGSAIKVCTVVCFPLGMNTSEVKAFEAAEAVRNGAQEVDMVLHIGALKAGDDDYVLRDIVAVVRAVPGITVKVILETAALTTAEKERACRLAVQAGAHYVKTSTGFGAGGATVEDVALMRAVVGPYVGVKASGGIRTREDALSMIAAGATRLGTSAGPQLVSDENSSVPASGKPEAY